MKGESRGKNSPVLRERSRGGNGGHQAALVSDFLELVVGKAQTEGRVPVSLAKSERDLIVEKTPAGPWLTNRLREVHVSRGKFQVSYFLYELHELLGAIALAANCTDAPSLVAELDQLYVRLEAIETAFIKNNGKGKGG